MNRNHSLFNERSFKARVFELSLHPVEFKARGLGAIRRTPKPAPYNPDARDGDNDGLRQEGTIWERPAGTVFLDIIKGARRLTRDMHIVDSGGKRVDYKPGDDPRSPLRGGGGERRIRGRGERRLARGNRQRARAGRQRARAEEQRPEIEALDEQIGKLEAAIGGDSKERLLAAEGDSDARVKISSFMEGFIEGFTGVKQNWRQNREDRTEKERGVLEGAIRMEGERRQMGDAAGNDALIEREMEFDDQILPEGIDRDEHRRLLDEDPEYRRDWNDRLAGMQLGMEDDGDVFIPLDDDGKPDPGLQEFPDADVPDPDVPEADAPEVDVPEDDVPEDDGPNARLDRRLHDQAFAIEDTILDEATNENELLEVEFAIDELDREATDAFNAGAIDQEDLDALAVRMAPVRENIAEVRRDRKERDAEIDADVDAGEDRGRAVDPPDVPDVPDDAPEDVDVPGEDIDVPEVGRPEEGWHVYADLSDEQLAERLDEPDPPDLDFLLREERRRQDRELQDPQMELELAIAKENDWPNRAAELEEGLRLRREFDEHLAAGGQDIPPDPPEALSPEEAGRRAVADVQMPTDGDIPAPIDLSGADDEELGRIVRGEEVEVLPLAPRAERAARQREARLEIDRRRDNAAAPEDAGRMAPEEVDEELRAILIQRPADLVGPLDDDPRMRELFQERDRRIAADGGNSAEARFINSDRERVRNLDDDELVEEIEYNRANNNQDELLNGLAERDQRRAARGVEGDPADLDSDRAERSFQPAPIEIATEFREDFQAVDGMPIGDEAGERRRLLDQLLNRIIEDRRDNPLNMRRDDPDAKRLSDNALRAVVEMMNDERSVAHIRQLRDGDGRLVRDLDSRVINAQQLRMAAVRGQLTPEMLDETIEALRRWEGIDAPAGNRGRLTRRLRIHRRELIEIRNWREPDNPDLLNMPNMDDVEFKELVEGRLRAQDTLRRAMMGHDADAGELPGQLEELRRINAEMPLLYEEAQRRFPRHRPGGGLQADISDGATRALSHIVQKADAPRDGVPGRTIARFNDIPQRDFADEDYEDAVRGVVGMMDNVKKKIRRVQHGRRGRGNDENKGVPAVAGHRANVDRALVDMDRRWQAAPRGSEERKELGKVRTKLRNLQGRLDKERDIRQGVEDDRLRREEEQRAGNVENIRIMREWDNKVDMDVLRDRVDNDLDDEALLADLDVLLERQDRDAMQGVNLNLINDGVERASVDEIQARANANRSEIKRMKTQVSARAAIRENRDWINGKQARIGELADIINNNPDGSPSVDREIMELNEEIGNLADLPQGSLRTARANLRENLKQMKGKVQERDNVRRVKELIDDDVRIGELGDKLNAGQIVEVGIDADIAEIAAILEEIGNLPRVRHNDELNERRRVHRQAVEDLRDRMGVARRDLVLGPLGDPVPWEGEDLTPARMANPTQGVRPRPAGLGIAGQKDANGVFRIEKVAVGNQGMNTQIQADKFVRGGGNISDVPDDFLALALLENASATEGDRFLIFEENGGAIGTTYVLTQRLPDGSYGKHGFLIKAHEPARDIEGLNELVGAEVAHNLGLPLLPGRANGKIKTRHGDIGTAVVLEHALNASPGGDSMIIGNPGTHGRNFDLGMIDRDAALNSRVDNFLVNWVLGVNDRHGNNGLMGHNSDGDVALIPVDLAWNFQKSYRDPSKYHSNPPGFGMDHQLIRDLKDAAAADPARRAVLEQQIRTMLERFNAMIGDPNEKERVFKGGAFRDRFSRGDVDAQWTKLNRHLDELTSADGTVDIDYVIGRMLG